MARQHRAILVLLLVFSGRPFVEQIIGCIANSSTEAQQLHGWNYRGCYHDGGPSRILNGTYSYSSEDNNTVENTVENCASFCSSQGYSFFGVEYRHQCFCDNVLNLNINHTLSEEADCNYACCPDVLISCGGVWYINVYEAISAMPTQSASATSDEGAALKPTPSSSLANSSSDNSNTSDNIQLGVGIGIGIPTLIATIVAIIAMRRRSISKNTPRGSNNTFELPAEN